MTNEMRHYDIWNIIMMTHSTMTDGLLNLESMEIYDWTIYDEYEMLSTTSKFCVEGEEL
jgi:hypothetical protein